VLDLRGNGGGYLDITLEIASYFCKNSDKRKPLVAVADYGEKTEKFYATGNCYNEYFSAESRIFVLADNQTASASECLIGCMIDYGAISYADICIAQRGEEVKTYGKGIMQTTYPLTGIYGDAVKLTTARICWPVSNRCIHGRGIVLADGVKTIAENINFEEETKNAVLVVFG
jgi:C-terminal processing protease CtpA/Prc